MRQIPIAGYLIMVGSVLCLCYMDTLFSNSKIVIVVQVFAFAIWSWSRITFGRRSFHAGAVPTAGCLVTSGPYRFIRHPIYTAACVFCWAGIFSNVAVAPIAAGVLLLSGAGIRVFFEERLLMEHFPEYRQYMTRTKRMIPYIF